jgi:hypothetical protein
MLKQMYPSAPFHPPTPAAPRKPVVFSSLPLLPIYRLIIMMIWGWQDELSEIEHFMDEDEQMMAAAQAASLAEAKAAEERAAKAAAEASLPSTSSSSTTVSSSASPPLSV